ncbi:MAG: F0F1 ATP synthase subunit B [Patescibacteria group bacterium]
MGELVSKLGIDWKLLLANTLTFFLVLWILRRFAYRPIMDVLDRRQKTIGEGLDAAKRSTDELAAIKRDKEQVLKEAKTEALAIVTEANQQGAAAKQKLAEQAQAEATATIERTKVLLDRERQAMVGQAKAELADLVVAATAKVLDRAVDEQTQAKLADQAIAALKEIRP